MDELLGRGTPMQGVIGNGRMTVCLRPDGSVRSLFWPHVGFAEQLTETRTGILVSNATSARFSWLETGGWKVSQRYIPYSVIETVYSCRGITVTKRSFVDKEVDAFVNTFRVSSKRPVSVKLFHYQDPELDEAVWGDANFYDRMHDTIIQYYRRMYFAFGAAEKSSSHQCGVTGSHGDARADCEDGRLENADAALHSGRQGVNAAIAYDLGAVSPGNAKRMTYLIAAAENGGKVTAALETARSIGIRSLAARTAESWSSAVKPINIRRMRHPSLYRRSVLTILSLCDRSTGGIIACPSTDPDYRYVWPRDGFYSALALDAAGRHEEASRFYYWCSAAQERTGSLHQRYFATPDVVGPAWGPSWGEEIDETAAAVWGATDHFARTKNRGFLNEAWTFISNGAWYLVSSVGLSGDVKPSMDLWEQDPSRHIYSAASVCAGLKGAATAAEALGFQAEARRWGRVSGIVRKRILEDFWDEESGHFVMSVEPRKPQVDISALSLSFPFSILPADDRRMAGTADALASAFRFPSGGIGRYPGDNNYGGNPWILATCWLSIVRSLSGSTVEAARLLDWCAKHATPLELLPEQVDKKTGEPLSAIPLAWSHAMFILASQELAKARGRAAT